jgi:hypothetical protein
MAAAGAVMGRIWPCRFFRRPVALLGARAGLQAVPHVAARPWLSLGLLLSLLGVPLVRIDNVLGALTLLLSGGESALT